MRVFNQDKTVEITDYDLTKGYLVDDELVTEHEAEIVHHPAVEAVEEQSHYEVIAEYPNGGKDVQKVIDVEAVEAKEAYDELIKEAYTEREPIHIYIPYTETQIAENKAKMQHGELMYYLVSTDKFTAKCYDLNLRLEDVYPEIYANRKKAREDINALEEAYPALREDKPEYPVLV